MARERCILVVEDDRRIREELVGLLSREGYKVRPAVTLGVAKSALEEGVELVLLDRGLPDGDGLELCRELRAAGSDLAVIILTARDAPEAIIEGLDGGADDYIVKPFAAAELLARVRTNLRRVPVRSGERLSCGTIWADPTSRQAGTDEGPVALKPREFELLVFLLENQGRPWTRRQLLARVWGSSFAGQERTVDVHVRRLRERLEPDPGVPLHILTEYGIGYRMEPGR